MDREKILHEALRVDWRLACQIKLFWANKTAYHVSNGTEIKTSGAGVLTDAVLQKLPALYSHLDVPIRFTRAAAQDNIQEGTLKNAVLFAVCLVHYSSGEPCVSEQHCTRWLRRGCEVKFSPGKAVAFIQAFMSSTSSCMARKETSVRDSSPVWISVRHKIVKLSQVKLTRSHTESTRAELPFEPRVSVILCAITPLPPAPLALGFLAL